MIAPRSPTQTAVLPLAVSGRARREPDDAALVKAARQGSREALEMLFRRHWPRLHRTAYLVCHDAGAAEDIAQEAFMSALRALDRFDRRRPLGPWLARIVANRAIDWTRARAVRREVLDAEPALHASAAGAGRAAAPESDIIGALATLAPEQRAVVVLRHLLGYTPREVAALLDLPVGTVNSRMRRGLDTLAAALAEEAP